MEDLIKRGYVSYEDFGAVGDGVTDDFGAIYKAHEFANENKLKVLGTPGKTYYIFDTALGTDTANAAVIKTSVDWRGAHFIIDDRELSRVPGHKNYHLSIKNIFSVEPEEEHKVIKIEDADTLARIAAEGINPKTERINLGIDWDGPVMIIPYNSSHKVFRRRGYGQYAGEPMQEVILLEADGRVSEETHIMFDYKRLDMGITRAYAGSNHAGVFKYNTDGRSPQWNIVITRAEFQSNTAINDANNNPDPSGTIKLAQ
jgi:hypothetical protein